MEGLDGNTGSLKFFVAINGNKVKHANELVQNYSILHFKDLAKEKFINVNLNIVNDIKVEFVMKLKGGNYIPKTTFTSKPQMKINAYEGGEEEKKKVETEKMRKDQERLKKLHEDRIRKEQEERKREEEEEERKRKEEEEERRREQEEENNKNNYMAPNNEINPPNEYEYANPEDIPPNPLEGDPEEGQTGGEQVDNMGQEIAEEELIEDLTQMKPSEQKKQKSVILNNNVNTNTNKIEKKPQIKPTVVQTPSLNMAQKVSIFSPDQKNKKPIVEKKINPKVPKIEGDKKGKNINIKEDLRSFSYDEINNN